MTRKIRQGGQWVQVSGANIDSVEVVQNSVDAIDPSKLYLIANSVTPSDLVTFRVNGKLGSGIWFGGNEMWVPPVQAVGGAETDIMVSGTPYRVHTFTSNLDFEVLVASLNVEYLIVGAGGNGGTANSVGLYYSGGGGGAGGDVLAGVITLGNGIYACTAGAGSDSSIASVATATKGANGGAGANPKAGNGGSNTNYTGGAGPSSASNVTGGGGGAGASANGSNGSVSGSSASQTGGAGGEGVLSSITGTAIVYGSGGGGGHGYGSFGIARAGGTGAGTGAAVNNATDPIANRGGGGGGAAGYSGPKNASNGAAGVIIIRYPLA
jgi:hypothetical protein